MHRSLAATVFCLLSPLASAQPMPASVATPAPITHVRTVADLAAVCDPAWSGIPRLEAIAYCQGFLTSAGQYHAMLHPAGGRAAPLYCVPTPAPTVAEAGLGFAAWARATPAHLQEAALDGLLRWAEARYPCPTRRATRPAR
jgi:hypothetical protein